MIGALRGCLAASRATGFRLVGAAAEALWRAARRFNAAFPGRRFQPAWAPAPLLRSPERTAPPLGWPRQTDSLCPECVKELRREVLSGRLDPSALGHAESAKLAATLVERDGKLWMIKRCARHGDFEDVLSIDPAFTRRIEQLFPGRDGEAPASASRVDAVPSTRYGRGAVLTVDLTNRCNMMCNQCFMDANHVGYVHELDWEDIRKILDDARAFPLRRQMSIQFSGGEPTLSPHFLLAVQYARQIGYFCVQCASNGIRFAQEPDFCHAAKSAGLRLVYLQFDGVANEAYRHRKIANLFDVKLRAIENLYRAGIDVVLAVTVVRGGNDHQVGPVVQFAIDNADKVTVVSFQPISFAGRDERIDDCTRHQQRYTLSHLAHDLYDQLGTVEPLRDWFPLSSVNPFSDVSDLLLGKHAAWGSLKCGCHPDCGIGTVLLVNKRTKQAVPVSRFLDVEQLLRDIQEIADAGHGRRLTLAELGLALARNFNPAGAPEGLRFGTLLRQLISQIGANGDHIGSSEGDSQSFEWRLLFIAGMWFQDLFNYDLRRTEMCIIPYGTQMGEVSFCAYNTGVGWRAVVERLHRSATLADWYRARGRHPVYAKRQAVQLPEIVVADGPAQKPESERRTVKLVS
ncbi:MAG: radical SAM protein [Polyangiaceae bacterium]|nr:radical SAM protein [Polyangiaceae bacterium]